MSFVPPFFSFRCQDVESMSLDERVDKENEGCGGDITQV